MTTTLKYIFAFIFSLMALLGLGAAFELVPASFGGLSAGGFAFYAWRDIRSIAP